jgi:hypothetical protein
MAAAMLFREASAGPSARAPPVRLADVQVRMKTPMRVHCRWLRGQRTFLLTILGDLYIALFNLLGRVAIRTITHQRRSE